MSDLISVVVTPPEEVNITVIPPSSSSSSTITVATEVPGITVEVTPPEEISVTVVPQTPPSVITLNTGLPGERGVGVSNAVIDGGGHLVFTMSDSSIIDAGVVSVAGGSDSAYVTKIADITLSGHRLVTMATTTTVTYADKDSAYHVLGMTTNSAMAGSSVSILTAGEIVEPSWSFTINNPVYLGNNGLLTQVVPVSGCILQVGLATAPTKLLIGIQLPIIIGG